MITVLYMGNHILFISHLSLSFYSNLKSTLEKKKTVLPEITLPWKYVCSCPKTLLETKNIKLFMLSNQLDRNSLEYTSLPPDSFLKIISFSDFVLMLTENVE